MGVNDADNWGDPNEVDVPSLISVEDLYVLIGQKEAALLGRDRIIASLRNTITNLTASLQSLNKKEVSDDIAIYKKQAMDAQRTADSLSAKNIKLGNRITELLHEIETLKAKPAPKRTKAKKKK